MRSRVAKLLKPATLLFAGILLFFLVFKPGGQFRASRSYTSQPSESQPPKPDLQIKELIFLESEKGRILWKLLADRGRMYKSKDLALLDNVIVDFFQEKGENWRLAGDTGTLDTKTLNMSIAGNVVARSDQGARLNSELLNWDNKKRQVYTDRKVRITREGHRIDGVGLEFDLDQEELRIKSQVTSRFESRGFSGVSW